MTGLREAVLSEWLKSRRSRVPWGVLAGFSLAPVVCGLFMVILKDPDAARRLGLLGTKAALTAGTADWPTMLSMLAQAIAVGGGVLFAFLTAWIFGREFSDKTVRGLLAVPTSRRAIVVAKGLVALGWGLTGSAWVIALGFAIGMVVGLPGWSAEASVQALVRMAAAAALTLVLQTATALFAGIGRGYIAPLGWAVATIAAAQILAVLGWGAVFPWAVPALVSGAAGPDAADVPVASFLIVIVTAAGGLIATIAWWERTDHTG
jgi:ABC-2 type transport system permease protein